MRASRPAWFGILAGVALLVIGGGMLALSVAAYLGSPRALNSASGDVVFTVDGRLVQYPPWVAGPELSVLVVGIIVLTASLVLAAITWKPRRPRVY
jgi:hypothetical protein